MPVDIIAFASSLNPLGDHHDLLLANALAQAQALAFGRTADQLREAGTLRRSCPTRRCPGTARRRSSSSTG